MYRCSIRQMSIAVVLIVLPVIAFAIPPLHTSLRQARRPTHENLRQCQAKTGTPPEIPADSIDPNQPIVPGCVVIVTVDGEAEPSGNYLVDGAGAILLRIADRSFPVSVKDQAATQAAATLTTFLKKYLRHPKVTVSIVSAPRPVVRVSGSVLISGPVQINRHTRLVDILNRAGFTDNSDLAQVRLARTEKVNGVEKKTKTILHLDSFMPPTPGKPLDLTQNPVLQDSDEIFVPYKHLAHREVVQVETVSITGEVQHPTEAMQLRPKMTLQDAVSEAGGTTPIANCKAVGIKRGTREILVDLDKAVQNDATNNIVLQSGDIIHVEALPASALIQVEGCVTQPGRYPCESHMMVTKAVSLAGGPAAHAKLTQCVIMHWSASGDPNKTKITRFNWLAIKKGSQKDIEILPGDAIYIPPDNVPQHPAPHNAIPPRDLIAH